MPEHLKALIVILALASVVFAVAKPAICAVAMPEDDFVRRRNSWYGVTLIAFLSHNFWIYICATAILLFLQSQNEKNPFALFFFLLFAVPMFPAEIPGLGGIRYLFAIHFVRLLALVILLPAFFKLSKDPQSARIGSLATDKFLLAYLGLNFALQLVTDTATNTLRLSFFYAFTDVFLPYYVASRSLKHIGQFREVLAAFVIAAMVMAPVGMFEFFKHWLLYSTLSGAVGTPWDYGQYLSRNEALRAMGTTGQSIALGYVMGIACGLFLSLRPAVPRPQLWWLGMGLLVAGFLAPVSRGPWVGAAVMLIVFLLTGPKPAASMNKLLGCLALLSPLLYLTGLGEKVIDYLPFVGEIDAENVTYRQRLIDVAIQVILENPVLGAYDYIYSPAVQELKQGDQGIIDIVNTYVAIGLTSGLVGLSLFAAALIAPTVGVFRTLKQSPAIDDESRLLGRVILAVLVATMVVILTVSSITVIPIVYWSLVGIAVAYVGLSYRAVPKHNSSVNVPPRLLRRRDSTSVGAAYGSR